MARALVELVGDSASAVRAAEQASVAFAETGDAAKKMAVDVDAAAAAMTKMSATRAEGLLAQSAALKQQAAATGASATEQAAAGELAIKKQAQAYKLLGIQAASTRASITQTAGTIGRGLTTYVTAPAAFIGYEAVKQALAYNQALLLIRTQAGASEQELQHMNSAVLQLAQSGRSYGQTAQQMAQGLYFVESEGIRGGRALAILQAAAAGAAKGQTSMADTTNALTSAMKIWNVSAGGAAKTMATIDAITATGKMHLEDLNNAFQTKFFTTSKQLGIPLEQAGAALDVFTKAGVPAEVAANNMTTSFIKMVTPAKAAIPYLQQLGLNATSLGQDLQKGGLSQALAALAQGYERLVQSSGKNAANKAVLESFGGSRSGAPALALVQQYASYMQSLGQIQRLNNPTTFWSQVAEAMNTPAMQMKKDLAEISADFIKLGTALAPTAATIAGGISHIANGFQALPGPVKEAVGIIVAVLAVGGPVGLAFKGIGTLLAGLRSAFLLIGPSAATGAAEAETSLAGIGTAADLALGPVGALVAALGLGAYYLSKTHGFTHVGGNVYRDSHGQNYLHPQGSPGGRGPAYEPISLGRARKDSGVYLGPTAGERARAKAEDDYWKHHRHRPGSAPTAPTAPPSDYFTTAIPMGMQLRLAKAQASGNVAAERKALEQEKRFIQHELSIAKTKSERLADLQAEISINSQLSTLAKKTVASTSQDELLARARNDIAQGELGAARKLLEEDRHRLQLLLSEAQTSAARTSILRQLATVNRLLHTKSDQFQLPVAMQLAIAKADAEAALHPSNAGPDAQQIALAKKAKAAALKAIHSHTLTMQGLIAAWQIVQQENSVLASAMGMINTYHAVSTAAVTRGLGLTHDQQTALRMRLAQSEAHRGHAPNGPGQGGGHPLTERQRLERVEHELRSGQIGLRQGERQIIRIDGGIHLHGIHNIYQLEAELAKLTRRKHQRAGARR